MEDSYFLKASIPTSISTQALEGRRGYPDFYKDLYEKRCLFQNFFRVISHNSPLFLAHSFYLIVVSSTKGAHLLVIS